MDSHLLEEAGECRRRAQAYVGQPEATFLLKVAREFERLALEERPTNGTDERDPSRSQFAINSKLT